MPVERLPNQLPVGHSQPQAIVAKNHEKRLSGLLASLTHLDKTGQIEIKGPAKNAHGGYSDMFFGYMKGPRTSRNARRNKVAIKRLRVHIIAEQDFEKMLTKEVSIWSRLDHPNVLVFVGYALEENGCPLLISEWMENGTIKEYVKSHADCNVHHLVIGIAEGLAYLHSKKVIPGDMKSANVLVSDSGQPQICDFGISRIISASESLFATSSDSHGPRGSMRWMAPEFFATKDRVSKHSEKTDIWAFGMTVYELLTGKVPYAHLTLDPLVLHALISKTTPSCPEEYDEWSLAYRRMWTVCKQCWNLDGDLRPSMLSISSMLRVKEPRILVPVLVADPGGTVEWIHICQGEINRMITFEKHVASRAELLNFEEDIPATITLLWKGNTSRFTVLTKQFSCPCVFDISGIDTTEVEINDIGGPIDQNDSTSLKLPIPNVSVESTLMVKIVNLLDHMVTVEQPEANIKRDFLPGQEFVFKLNRATIYCFTFRSREKMTKYHYMFTKEPCSIVIVKEKPKVPVAWDMTIAANMVFLYIVNFNTQFINVKSTCNINVDLLPAQVYSCQVEAGVSHEFLFTCNGITVTKLYHFDKAQGQEYRIINACEFLSSGLPRKSLMEVEDKTRTTRMTFCNLGLQTITIKNPDAKFSADCIPHYLHRAVSFQFVRGPCSFTFTQGGITKHQSYTFNEVEEKNLVFVKELFETNSHSDIANRKIKRRRGPRNTITLKNPGYLLVSVKCLALEFEVTLLPQDTTTHSLDGLYLRKTYEFMLSCHGVVEKIKLDRHTVDRTIDAGPIYETISRTQSLQITSHHCFHGLDCVNVLKRYIKYGSDDNDWQDTGLKVYI